MSKPEKTRVLVIGAGVSGLTAARQVKDQRPDAEVVVLEARERLGGRVWSESFSDGSTIDLGAHFLHGLCDEHPIAQIAKDHPEWGQLVEMDWDTCPDFEQGSGQQISEQQLKRCEELYEKTWDLYESGQKQRRAQLEEDRPLWEQLQRDFDWSQLSTTERSMLRWRWARETEWIYAAPMEELSAQWWNDDEEFEGPDCMWPTGFVKFMGWLSEGLDIRLGCPVARVVSGEKKSVTVHCADGAVFVAEVVIVTLPLGVLKAGAVEFIPPLSAKKQAAIQSVGMALLNKVALRFQEPFWPQEICGFNHVPQVCKPEDVEPHEWVFQPRCAGPVAVAFFSCSSARRVEHLSDESLRARLLRILAETFDSSVKDLEASLLELKRSRWEADEFSRGSYSYLPCGVAPWQRASLAEPHGERVIFAGEHCRNDYPSTLHGAYLSGCRAAEDAIQLCMRSADAGGYR